MFHRIYDFPFLGNTLKKYIAFPAGLRYRIRPAEAGRIWHTHSGFKKETKTTENDLTNASEQKIKHSMKMHLLMTGKKRFMAKQTSNNQRIRLIHRLFPDAHYVHIIRDGRAVASSLYHVKWWHDVDIWWLGATPRQWEETGKSPIGLCAMQWKMDVNEILENKKLFGDRYLEIKYEQFVQNVPGTIDRILAHCKLKPSRNYLQLLPDKLQNMNYKWSVNLTPEQKETVENTISDMLIKFGYI